MTATLLAVFCARMQARFTASDVQPTPPAAPAMVQIRLERTSFPLLASRGFVGCGAGPPESPPIAGDS